MTRSREEIEAAIDHVRHNMPQSDVRSSLLGELSVELLEAIADETERHAQQAAAHAERAAWGGRRPSSGFAFISNVSPAKFFLGALAIFAVALGWLALLDALSDQEPPRLPDCEEDEVLHIAPYGYVEDPQQRVYECRHPDDL